MPGIFDINGKAPPPPGDYTPREDPYGFKGKNQNYPKGQFTRFIDGRPLRDCEFLADWGVRTNLAGVTSFDRFEHIVPLDRALYIERVILIGLNGATTGTDCFWQIWKDNVFLWGGVCTMQYIDIKIYIPPESRFAFYFKLGNAPGASATWHWSIQFIEFDAARDTWPWGKGTNHVNPLAGDIAWP